MAVRSIRRITSTSQLRSVLPNAIDVGFDSTALKYKDANGTVQQIVKASDTDPFSAVDGAMRYAEVAISSAELLALRATPKTLVAAPGAGKMLAFHNALIIADNGTAYTVGTNDAAIRYKDGTGDIVSQTIDSAGLLDSTSDIVTQVGPVGTDTKSPKADVENQPLVLHNTGAAEWTVGTGVVRVKLWYSVVTTGW